MELIKRGVPTVVLVNEDFIGTAEAVAKSRGLSTLPYVVFPRTISIMPPEEVEAITEKAANKILALLKAGPQS